MNREIKFRIKYLGDDSLGIPSLATPPSWEYIYFPSQFRGEELYCGESSYDWDTFTQWTGLKDDNGQEIYEGDIVKIRGYEAIGYVHWKEVAFWIKEIKTAVDNDTTWSGTMGEEVIGNIYENPELLEDE